MTGQETIKLNTFRIEKSLPFNHIVLYPTLIQVNNQNYLVDCGYDETFEEFVEALERIGVRVQDLHAIIITHDDIDHLGALYRFRQLNQKLLVLCSETEAPSVSGKIKSERLHQAESSLDKIPEEYKKGALEFIRQLKQIRRVNIDRTVTDNEIIEPGLIVLHTPGHTKGHISLFIPEQSTVIASDAVVIENGELNVANPQFTLDMRSAVESLRKIATRQPDKLICYHGGILTENIAGRLQALADKYSASL